MKIYSYLKTVQLLCALISAGNMNNMKKDGKRPIESCLQDGVREEGGGGGERGEAEVKMFPSRKRPCFLFFVVVVFAFFFLGKWAPGTS